MRDGAKQVMARATVASAVFGILFFLLECYLPGKLWLFLFIASCTTFYHLAVRLLVGGCVKVWMRGPVRYDSFWFREKSFEAKLYQKCKVKHWKKKMPTYTSEDFSLRAHTVDEIIHTMCVSETVHELFTLLSFVPLAVSLGSVRWREDAWLYAVTGVLAAAYDAIFVILQRYNRPRLVRTKEKLENRKERKMERAAGRCSKRR